MEHHEELQERYEDALFALLMEELLEAEGPRLLEENERLKRDPFAAVPEASNRRCIRAIKRGFVQERRQAAVRVTRRVLHRVVLAAAICALLFATAFAASPELRASTLKLFLEDHGEYSTLTLQGSRDDNQAALTEPSDDPTLICGYRVPDPPEGFTVWQKSDKPSPLGGFITYQNEDGDQIIFMIDWTNGGETVVDTEDAKVTDIMIHGYEGMLIEKRYEFQDEGEEPFVSDSVMVIWGDTDHSIMLHVDGSNVDREIILEMARQITYEG